MRTLVETCTGDGESVVMLLPAGIGGAVCDGIDALGEAAAAGRRAIGFIPDGCHLEGLTAYAATVSRRTPRWPVEIGVAMAAADGHLALSGQAAPALAVLTLADVPPGGRRPDLAIVLGFLRTALCGGGRVAIITPCQATSVPSRVSGEIVAPVARILRLRQVGARLTVHSDPVDGALVGHAQVWVFAMPEVADA
ncbi:hypothetical protein [Acrocarpospora sp. B8E8]|uniref:hypothetical protein n=1 Tax=Acrocarpospora sp. B8E8 TaxID=3153572 RepID=UPI00325FD004